MRDAIRGHHQPNGSIGAEATLDLEELHCLLGERAEVAVDHESPCTCGEGRKRRRGEHLHAEVAVDHESPCTCGEGRKRRRGEHLHAEVAVDLESPCTEEDVEALLQEDDRLTPGVPNQKGRFDEISDR